MTYRRTPCSFYRDPSARADKIAVNEMPMASGAATPDQIEAWRKLASMALEATAKRPVEFSADDRSAFTGRLRDTLAALDGQAGNSQILIAAGSLAEAIEQYNGQAQRRFGSTIDRFRALARFLLDRGQALPATLKQEIELAIALKDLPVLEEKLQHCLETAKNVPTEAASADSANRMGSSAPPADLCTGLPTLAEAQAFIQRIMSSGVQAYVAAFYLHRMHLINARFGDAIGNQVILFCSQHIANHLSSAKDALFRWRGPGFVAVLERNESPLTVASEVQRFTAMPLSRFFETPSRTVYLPIKLTAEVVPTTGKTFEDVIDQVQKSLHAHAADA